PARARPARPAHRRARGPAARPAARRADRGRRRLRPAGRGRPPHLGSRVRRAALAASRLRPAAPARLRGAPAPPAPPQGRRAAAAGVQKKFPDRIAEVVAAHPGERVETWFEDEARFGQQGTLTRVWAERGTRPTAPKQVGYANLHVLTAVCPATGQAEGLICQRLNAGVVQLFLDQLSATIPVGVHVALVWDGACWHTAGSLRVRANLTLIPLPPYSPELNPVERLWLYLRGHHWSNRVYKGIGALEAAAECAWRVVCLDPDKSKTVCRCGYAVAGS